MNEKEQVDIFGDAVNATMKMNRPWIIICALLVATIIATNAFWAYVHYKQIKFAYMTPENYSQSQDFDGKTQTQEYSQGTTQGD